MSAAPALAPAAYTPAEIAARLAISEQMFLSRRSRMVRDHGFPRHLPGNPLRWSRALVDQWIDQGGPVPETGDSGRPATPAIDLNAHRQRLEQRYGGRA